MPADIVINPSIAYRLRDLLGASSVFSDEAVLQKYSIEGIAPQAMVQPENTEQVIAVLRVCNEQDWVIVPFGGGTRQHVGLLPERVDVVLSTERLNAIEVYDPGDLTISLQSGVKVANTARVCCEHQQVLPIDASAGATIGGAMATAASGPLRTGFGGLRDFCIGLSFITGDGASGRGGGRVVKNVAGYDLMKLMIGSYGSLGVIVSANFKLFPAPQQTMTFICEFKTPSEISRFRDRLLKSPLSPLCGEIISPLALDCLSDAEPRDPDSWAPNFSGDRSECNWRVALRFSGSDRVLTRCRQELASCVVRDLVSVDEDDLWTKLREFELRVIKRHRNAMIFQVDVSIAESEAALTTAQESATDHNFTTAVIGRVMLGSLMIAFLPLAIDPPSVTQFAGAASTFRSRLARTSSAIVLRCPREAKQHFDVWGSTPTDLELMQKIKRALDPKGILNRGRFLTG